MAESNGYSNGNGTANRYGPLTWVANFIRDFGTPIAVLAFVALVYTGFLHSPLTDIQNNTANDGKEHGDMLDAIKELQKQENTHHWQNLAVAKRTCRNTAPNESARALCDDINQANREPADQ